MIELKHEDNVYSDLSNTVGLKLKQSLKLKNCLAFFDEQNNEIYDLHSHIQGPIYLQSITKNDEKSNVLLRSSLALILASCVDGELVALDLNENGFSCKFKTDLAISETEFEFFSKMMLKKISQGIEFEKNTKSFDESSESDNKYFASVAEDGPNAWYKFENVEMISYLPFLVNSAECSNNFVIEKVAQEDFQGFKVQKITVAAFFNKDDLDAYLEKMELLKQNDHRKIGQTQELFHFIPQAPGSPFWLANGYKLFRNVEKLIRAVCYKDYMEVKTPFVMSSCFWEKSGHMAAFEKNMMHVQMGEHKEELAALKPMNCPGHIEIYKQKIRSYKDLPFRLAEFGSCHRYEPSGALHGLMRVRSFTIDDGHIFCSREQIKDEVKKFMEQAVEFYKKLKFFDLQIVVSTRPEKFLGEIENWDYAQKMLEEGLNELNLEYKIANGEGAFYGPKIELHVLDNMKRQWQLGTIQLDFVLPERFNIVYDDANNLKQTPCMLHRAMVGSIERFLAVLLEHTQGHLPLNLVPIQAVVCSVVTDVNDYAKTVFNKLEKIGISANLDIRAETLGYKIREHKKSKIPMLIIIGKEEMNNKTITLEYASNKHVYEFDKINEILNFVGEND